MLPWKLPSFPSCRIHQVAAAAAVTPNLHAPSGGELLHYLTLPWSRKNGFGCKTQFHVNLLLLHAGEKKDLTLTWKLWGSTTYNGYKIPALGSKLLESDKAAQRVHGSDLCWSKFCINLKNSSEFQIYFRFIHFTPVTSSAWTCCSSSSRKSTTLFIDFVDPS